MGPRFTPPARFALLLVLLLVSPTLTLQAQTAPDDSTDALHDPGHRMQEQVEITMDSLNLTGRQQDGVRPILEDSFAERSAIMEKYGIDPADLDAQRRPGYRTMRKMQKEMRKVQDQTERRDEHPARRPMRCQKRIAPTR